jgi:hypothetical protein
LIDISRALESALISFAWLSTRLDGFRALVKGAEGAVPRVCGDATIFFSIGARGMLVC